VARSKEDQLGLGAFVDVPRGQHVATCPVRALRAWLGRAGRPVGPLFRVVRGTVVEHERMHVGAVSRAVGPCSGLVRGWGSRGRTRRTRCAVGLSPARDSLAHPLRRFSGTAGGRTGKAWHTTLGLRASTRPPTRRTG
jgi:hypothetical protein